MNAVILDNWTLQTIGELFDHGYDKRSTQALVVKGKQHGYEPAVIGDLQLMALVDMLSNILLRDKLSLDAGFVHAWQPFRELFQPLDDARMFKLTKPPTKGSAIADGTAFIVKQLCVTSSLKRIQSVNERHFEEHQESKYPYQSQLVWGSAGMLSRSNVFDAPYVGHPLRQRFLASTGVFTGQRDVVQEVVELVKDKRASIYSASTPALDLTYAKIMIPAVAVAVIMKAKTASELISIAVAERDRHKKLRNWLSTFRAALAEGDTITVAKHRKYLNLLSRDVDRLIGKSSSPTFSLGISASGPSASLPVGEWLRMFIGRFSIRHDLMQQVKVVGDAQALKKLRKLF
ncbi:MAG: hypothetical protein K8H89_13095 [Flavobacteriales bacterium]|nr:hypothetical protein [Flavobacteriales bacterium]